MRPIIAAVVGCVYVAAASWVISREGARHRAEIRAARVAVEVTPSPAGPLAAPVDPAVAAPRTADATPSIGPAVESGNARASTGDLPTPAPLPAADPRPVARPRAGTPQPAEAASPTPRDSWADGLDLDRLSAADETRLGLAIRGVVLRMAREAKDDERAEWLSELARPFLDVRSRKEIEYSVTVLDSEAFNAFSTPGGFIYVCRGVFDQVGEGEEHIIEAILAHEVAHVDMRHAVRVVGAASADGRSRGVGTVSRFLVPIAFAYPREMEYEADRWAFDRQRAAGRSSFQGYEALRRLDSHAANRKFRGGGRAPEGPGDSIMNHFAAHPAPRDRLRKLGASLPPAGPRG